MTLEQTVKLMTSDNYKDRFIAEYWQTKIRYERLKDFNNKIEAAKAFNCHNCDAHMAVPVHDCPDSMLQEQQHYMGNYLHVLEVRAVIEGIDLKEAK